MRPYEPLTCVPRRSFAGEAQSIACAVARGRPTAAAVHYAAIERTTGAWMKRGLSVGRVVPLAVRVLGAAHSIAEKRRQDGSTSRDIQHDVAVVVEHFYCSARSTVASQCNQRANLARE